MGLIRKYKQIQKEDLWNYGIIIFDNLFISSLLNLTYQRHATKNGHLFYIICKSIEERDCIIKAKRGRDKCCISLYFIE